MKITEVRVTKGDWGKTKALANVTFDGCFVVTGIKVIEGNNGNFIGMPSRETKQKDDNGRTIYKDICFPLSKDFREEITAAVLKEFGDEPVKEEAKKEDFADDGLPF